MSNTENLGTDGNERPFMYLKETSPIGWREEDDYWEESNYLKFLHLTEESTSDDVRRTAISLKSRLHGAGFNDKELKALRFVLEKTNDCVDDREFLGFLLENVSFERIRAAR